ncbi:DMT family transporter [Paragemmobacter ruber]|uniref:EamA family transporter n=1 Tax=Paragemmobacter ruber TaxID=1985673 RepID=A0ABW9YAD1_9RHOB|nr:DMT family transporter [Rhodobacter ruber]NBE09104.1 EamA family transporter [Rhodobacter ruber]
MDPEKPRTIIGIALMLGAMAVLPFLDVVAKMLGNQGMPILQIVWARMAFSALLTLPFTLRHGGIPAIRPDRPAYHTLRAALLIAATFLFFSALKYLPIADALAIFFVQPLILTAISPILLNEKVGPRRWAAVAVGFVGTLIIIRPGFTDLNPGTLLALGAGASLAVYFAMTRRIAGSAPAMVTTFHTSLMGAILTTLAVIPLWDPPTAAQWGLLFLIGCFATVGHFLIVRAYDHAEASLLAPLAYTEIIMATLAGWWFFGDFPDGWTFFGVAILIACATYISIRERKAALKAIAPRA